MTESGMPFACVVKRALADTKILSIVLRDQPTTCMQGTFLWYVIKDLGTKHDRKYLKNRCEHVYACYFLGLPI
jgi:hypothetical protein